MNTRHNRATILGIFLTAAAAAASAQPYGDSPEIRQTVARVGYFSGDVSFARGDDPDDWQPADLNVPMTLGDRVWTGDGRLELQVHGGHLIRLASGTDLTALNLSDDTKQFSISAGSSFFRIRSLRGDEVFEVDTPNSAVTLERAGDYRVNVDPNGNTQVEVRRGRAIAAAGGGQIALAAGQSMSIDGIDSPRYDVAGLPPPDDWDGWVEQRDARLAHARSYRYVSADIAGAEDLDQYGRWETVPSYGWVWTPASVAPGWAPYRVGRWMWQDPWGWTWISSEPWGWAPYHYGRWVFASRWYWVPVAAAVQTVAYAPALVAFTGGGPGWSATAIAAPGAYIGWFPLAPRDPLIPWWGPRVNVQVTNVTYVNRTYVTVVNQNVFVGGQAVARSQVRDQTIVRQIEQAPVIRGPVPVVPTRESIRVAATTTSAARPPAAVVSRPVVTRIAPPPAPPRFDAKVAVIRDNRGAPVQPAQATQLAPRQPAQPVRPVVSDAGRVVLAPKTENAKAVRPEPVSPSGARPAAASAPGSNPSAPAQPEAQRQPKPVSEPGRPAAQESRAPSEREPRSERPQSQPHRAAPRPTPRHEAERESSSERPAPPPGHARPESVERPAQHPAPTARPREGGGQERGRQHPEKEKGKPRPTPKPESQ